MSADQHIQCSFANDELSIEHIFASARLSVLKKNDFFIYCDSASISRSVCITISCGLATVVKQLETSFIDC